MNKLGVFLMVGMTLVGAVTCRADEKPTIRDSQGRIPATVTTDRYGKKTIRDSDAFREPKRPTATARRLGATPPAAFKERRLRIALARRLTGMDAAESSAHARFSKGN